MVQQHAYYGQNFNGEGTMKLLYGEYPGQDFNFPYMAPGWSPLMNKFCIIRCRENHISPRSLRGVCIEPTVRARGKSQQTAES